MSPTSITFSGNTVTFEYFKNRLLKTTFPNGITSDYLFNANSWLTNITTKQGATPLSSFQYSFDNVGNITNKNTEQGNTAYSYDLKYQLTDSVSLSSQEPFTYDAAGNRLTGTSTPTGLTFGTTQFYYNARNRLERVTLPDGRIAAYTYDPFGRRIKKTITPPGGGAGVITYYAYSDEGLIGEYNATGALIKAYGWKPNSTWGTDPVFMVENGSYYFYHNDHLGTPQRLMDASGTTVWSATYTAFGEAAVNSASTVVNNLRFPGQYFDEETGLHYNWNRYYNPKTGRYTQEDPIGFEGGDDNLYMYTANNPLIRIDYLGLDWIYDTKTNTLHQTDSNGNISNSWPAVSGPWGNGPLEPGDYSLPSNPVSVPPTHPQQSSFCDGVGNCWWQPITPNFPSKRKGLGIHPDGNVPGTSGCVGATDKDTRRLRDALTNDNGPLKVR